MTKEETNQNELLEFNWENGTEDFFGIKEDKTDVLESVKKEETTEEETEEKEGKKKETEVEEKDEDFFELNPQKVVEKETDSTVYGDLYKDLKEQGIFKHVEIQEDDDIDVDKFLEIQEEEYEAEVSERLKSWATEELDEDARAFIKFKREGGNTQDFFSAYKKDESIPVGDIEDEDYQDDVIRYQLRKEGWDREEIEDRLSFLTDSGKKQKVAEKYNEKIIEEENKNKQLILKQAEENRKASLQQEEDFRVNVKEALDTTKASVQDKNKTYNFLTKKDYKISDTKAITGFQKKLSEVFQDTNKLILLARLLEKDFDMTGFEKQVIDKETKKIKTNLEQRKGIRSFDSGSSSKGSSLAELFN